MRVRAAGGRPDRGTGLGKSIGVPIAGAWRCGGFDQSEWGDEGGAGPIRGWLGRGGRPVLTSGEWSRHGGHGCGGSAWAADLGAEAGLGMESVWRGRGGGGRSSQGRLSGRR
jgi:hypothetical protein